LVIDFVGNAFQEVVLRNNADLLLRKRCNKAITSRGKS
jgi:hypothetical protein